MLFVTEDLIGRLVNDVGIVVAVVAAAAVGGGLLLVGLSVLSAVSH